MSDSHITDTGIEFANERNAPPPEAEPTNEVYSWRIFKALSADLHLGTLRNRQAERAVVRLTSSLAVIDAAARVVITVSGRRYALMGPPESRTLERMAICSGAQHLGLADGIDISDQIWAAMRAS